MHPHWAKPLSVLLLAVFLFNTCILGLILSGLLCYQRKTQLEAIVHATIKGEELIIDASTVETSNDEFHWKEDHEFEYLGEMYDVISKVKSGDNWIFTCIKDSDEKALKALAEKQVDGQHDSGKQSKKSAKANSEYIAGNSVSSFLIVTSAPAMPARTQPVDDAAKQIPSPPPWFI